MTESKKNHHFVPQGLLRNWYSTHEGVKNKGFRKYQRIHSGEIVLNRNIISTKSTCSQENLNTTYTNLFLLDQEYELDTDSIENELAEIDSKGIETIHKILLSNSFNNLNNADNENLSKFILSLHLRHPEMIQSVIEDVTEKGAHILKIIKKNIEKQEYLNHIDLMQRNNALNSITNILEVKENYEHIMQMNWFLISAEGIEFFSGEKPLIVNFSENERIFSFGFALALSPTTLMIGVDSRIFLEGEVKMEDLFQFIAPHYNLLVCKQSKYIITTKELPEELFEIFVKDNLAPLLSFDTPTQ